jgi:hypothetical protein
MIFNGIRDSCQPLDSKKRFGGLGARPLCAGLKTQLEIWAGFGSQPIPFN